MIRVLVVDDSTVARELICHILTQDAGISIAGTAASGNEAVRMAMELKPDVITMDVHMPGVNGYDATRQIMERTPVPIVIVSASTSTEEVGGSFKALESGAVALFERPVGISHPKFESQAQSLRNLVKAMAEVPVVRRWAKPASSQNGDTPDISRRPPQRSRRPVIVGIGASTGGPVALQQILRRLRKPFPLPVLVVQHISPGFLEGFVEWLEQSTGFPVRIAQDRTRLEPGLALVAPDGQCMTVGSSGLIRLVSDKHTCTLMPSVGHLFDSLSEAYGDRTIGVLLTGMGKDGAVELSKIRDRGGRTFAQNEESSVVFGMPGEAKRLGAAEQLLAPERIADRLNELARVIAAKE